MPRLPDEPELDGRLTVPLLPDAREAGADLTVLRLPVEPVVERPTVPRLPDVPVVERSTVPRLAPRDALLSRVTEPTDPLRVAVLEPTRVIPRAVPP